MQVQIRLHYIQVYIRQNPGSIGFKVEKFNHDFLLFLCIIPFLDATNGPTKNFSTTLKNYHARAEKFQIPHPIKSISTPLTEERQLLFTFKPLVTRGHRKTCLHITCAFYTKKSKFINIMVTF